MLYIAKLGDGPVTLDVSVKGDTLGVVAEFRLFETTEQGTNLIDDSKTAHSSFQFDLPASQARQTRALRLDTQPAFNGATTADVLIAATQNGNALNNADPDPQGPTYLRTLTKSGVIESGPFSVLFS